MNSVSRSTRLALLASLAAVAALPAACGGGSSNANANFSFGTDAGAAPPGQPCAPGQPCPPPTNNCAPGQPCPPPAATTAAAPSASNGCANGQPCNPLDPNMLAGLLGAASAFLGQMGGDPVDLGIKAAALKYAPGMNPEGQVAKGQVAEGGHVQFILNMDASKCYTVVGFGAGVTDLDVNLLAPPLYNVSAGHDETVGPTAVIGGAPHPTCPIIPIAIPYKVDLFARKGGGSVGAQVYSRAK